MFELHKFRQVNIFDTTLRDGEQAPGYSMTVDQKVKLAEELESLGVNTIETGFPMSSPVDFEATQAICRTLKKAQPCGFSRTVSKDIEACAKAMADATNPQIELATVASDIHMIYKRNMNRAQVVKEAIDGISCARSLGFQDISLGLEDATRGDMEFMKKLIGEAIEHGITAIAVPDTVGCCLPDEFYSLVKQLREFVGDNIRISIHCHNDMGLAVANSIAGIKAGADEVQTTLCGIGERAGNTSLEELISVLNTKRETLYKVHSIVSHKLVEACHLLREILDLPIPYHKPIVGRNAFASEAGMHQQGLMKHRFTYEWLQAEDYGATPLMMIGRHSGRNIIRNMLLQKGIKNIENQIVDYIYEDIMANTHAEKYIARDLIFEKYKSLTQVTCVA
ncbi:LeuA family protein [Anabaena subtropica]|uniref:2-isopropylmalate synthase n=1 Tax=Anabaena subtropica FACHB-260 TaxID=2692884 RepID=A0ABR8CKQ9_9NOST|nr:pyruvate carboxyltransferase [Anabaena subtropica]MBD2342705.1 pyruvate carboxyltransferase [Anabaena subtropica FACHB-260]